MSNPALSEPPASQDPSPPTGGSPSTDIAALAARLPTPPPDDRRSWTDASLFVAIQVHRGQLAAACQAIGIRTKAVRAYAKTHPEFKAALEHELEVAEATTHSLVIKTYWDLAIDGFPKYEYANDGTLLRKTITHDPRHIQHAAAIAEPETFHLPTRHEHTGAAGAPIRFKFEMDDGPLNINDVVDGEADELEDADWDAA